MYWHLLRLLRPVLLHLQDHARVIGVEPLDLIFCEYQA